MALAKEIMGVSVLKKSPFVTSSDILLFYSHFSQRSGSRVYVKPVVCSDKKRFQRTTPLAAITESLVKIAPAELAFQFKVKAVITVRNNSKEDLKDSLVKRWDSLTDLIRRNVVLQLISTEVDPSKFLFSFLGFQELL